MLSAKLFLQFVFFKAFVLASGHCIAPNIIAHRGSSGEYPGLTLGAFQRAVDNDADVIELDTAITKDGKVVVLHEPELSLTTDVIQKSQNKSSPFYKRNITDTVYSEDGTSYTKNDWWVWDFEFHELQTLTKKQRFQFRSSKFDNIYMIPSLEQVIQLLFSPGIFGANLKLLIEVKLCQYYTDKLNLTGISTEVLISQVLKDCGVFNRSDIIILQAFEETCALNLKKKAQLLAVHQIYKKSDINRNKMTSWKNRGLSGIAIHKALIATGSPYPPESPLYTDKYEVNGTSDIVSIAKSIGLLVNVWTIRNEDRYISQTFLQDAHAEIIFFINAGVDGIITDFPLTVKSTIDCLHKSSSLIHENYYLRIASILLIYFYINLFSFFIA